MKTIPQNCSSYVVDGDCIRALYNMPAQNSNRKVNPNNALGIYEGGENYDKADLKLWIENYAPYIPVDTIPELSSVDGGEGPVPEKDAGVEALLDITIAYELIYLQVVNIFSVDVGTLPTQETAPTDTLFRTHTTLLIKLLSVSWTLSLTLSTEVSALTLYCSRALTYTN